VQLQPSRGVNSSEPPDLARLQAQAQSAAVPVVSNVAAENRSCSSKPSTCQVPSAGHTSCPVTSSEHKPVCLHPVKQHPSTTWPMRSTVSMQQNFWLSSMPQRPYAVVCLHWMQCAGGPPGIWCCNKLKENLTANCQSHWRPPCLQAAMRGKCLCLAHCSGRQVYWPDTERTALGSRTGSATQQPL
jgi:hypothetical protein